MSDTSPTHPVRLLASAPIATTEPTTSLADLANRLELERIGALAVMTGNRLDGVVSERDIVRALAAGGDLDEVWAADVMAETTVEIDAEEPIIVAAERMLDEGVRHLPVVEDGQVVGVVSMRDVLRVFTETWRRTRALA